MSDIRKVRMKVGDAEFEAEVPHDQVQPMYDRFLALLERRPAAPSEKPAAAETPGGDRNRIIRHDEPDDALMSRIFELRQDGIVALRVLPNGKDRDADALLLILYGYRRLKHEEHILATHLLRSAKFSGLSQIDRIDRGLATCIPQYVIRGGQRKGSTYTANNQGLQKAREIVAHMFD